MIDLPDYPWFYQITGGWPITNIFTGSIGTDPSGGCINVTTFNYKVFIDSKADPKRLVAQCFNQFPWKSSMARSETVTKDFENSQEGYEEAKKWLDEELMRHQNIRPR